MSSSDHVIGNRARLRGYKWNQALPPNQYSDIYIRAHQSLFNVFSRGVIVALGLSQLTQTWRQKNLFGISQVHTANPGLPHFH